MWDDIWWSKDQQGQRQLEQGNASDAAELFENTDWQAVAKYGAGDYAGSAAQFVEQGDVRNLYNLGNALARQGEFASAIDAYEQVLEIDADDVDAEYNRDLLQQILEQQQSQQQNGGDQQQESSDQSGGDSEQSDGDSSPDRQGASQSDSDVAERDASQREDREATAEDLEALQQELQRAADQAEQEDHQSTEQLSQAELDALRRAQEQQQALEQWLRRIPNDPGGLLRNKFRYQYQRSGRDQDGNNLWPDDEVQPW